jgi:DNA-binding NtrC family response regulator
MHGEWGISQDRRMHRKNYQGKEVLRMNHSIKVLIVDDENRFRETTKKVLQYQGFQVILAESGAEALAKLSENPDVVVLDIKMPGMDGHETLDKIKARAPDLPVIMLTGHGARPSAQSALSKGAFEYLTKPCDIDLLTKKIMEAYRRSPKME